MDKDGELYKAYRGERDARISQRIHACLLVVESGRIVSEAADIVYRSRW